MRGLFHMVEQQTMTLALRNARLDLPPPEYEMDTIVVAVLIGLDMYPRRIPAFRAHADEWAWSSAHSCGTRPETNLDC